MQAEQKHSLARMAVGDAELISHAHRTPDLRIFNHHLEDDSHGGLKCQSFHFRINITLLNY